jgi:hypothetical protein
MLNGVPGAVASDGQELGKGTGEQGCMQVMGRRQSVTTLHLMSAHTLMPRLLLHLRCKSWCYMISQDRTCQSWCAVA